MKQLEKHEKVHENVETTFNSSPNKLVINQQPCQKPDVGEECQPTDTVHPSEDQEKQQVAVENQVVPISELLDVDSLVINYG